MEFLGHMEVLQCVEVLGHVEVVWSIKLLEHTKIQEHMKNWGTHRFKSYETGAL